MNDGEAGARLASLDFAARRIAPRLLSSTVSNAVNITSDATRYVRQSFTSSGEWAAWSNTDGDLVLLHVPTKTMRKINTWQTEFSSLAFSPDTSYIAFEHPARNQFSQISVYDIKFSTLRQVTAPKFNSFSPVWSQKGLYYLSDGDVHTTQSSPWGTRAPGPVWDGRCNVFLAPFEGQQGQPIAELAKEAYDPAKASVLDFAVKPYPITGAPADKYSELVHIDSGEENAFVVKDATLISLPLQTPPSAAAKPAEPKVLLTGVIGCGLGINCTWCETISGFQKSVDMATWAEVATGGLTLRYWPKLEWLSMYGDAWRMLRDYFYDSNLHGLDWPAIYVKYEPLVHHCNSREDLDDVLKMMSSELSALHVFVYGGEYRAVFTDTKLSLGEAVADLGASFKR